MRHREPEHTALELSPLEATRLVDYINNHKGKGIELTYDLGIGMGYHIEVTSEYKDKKEITDFDCF